MNETAWAFVAGLLGGVIVGILLTVIVFAILHAWWNSEHARRRRGWH